MKDFQYYLLFSNNTKLHITGFDNNMNAKKFKL